jgi:predicted SnoaL-like aldol condensation-catalyzing enzyme
MFAEEHKPIHWRLIKKIMNRHNVDRIEEVLRSNFIEYAPSVLSGVAGACQLTAASFTAFPDLHLAMDDLMAEGDQVVVHLAATGTHQGASMAFHPLGSRSPSRPLRRGGSWTWRIPSSGPRWTASASRTHLP